jgi:heptosyltransferase-3
MKSPPRVLVIRGGAIGDFILTLPAMRLLREMIPNCHLEVMGYLSISSPKTPPLMKRSRST